MSSAAGHAAVFDLILAEKLFAIVRGVGKDRIVETARALYRGGVRLLEVTFDQTSPAGIEETLESLRRLHTALGDQVCLGAGTVLDPEQVRLAARAGARFMVSPDVNPAVIGTTKEQGLVSLPGALTATEVVQARRAGADAVKLFPVGPLGPGYVKALGDPLKGIPLLAVGGVDAGNLARFLAAGAIGVGVGGQLVNAAEANAGRFAALEERARVCVAAVRSAG